MIYRTYNLLNLKFEILNLKFEILNLKSEFCNLDMAIWEKTRIFVPVNQ